MCTEKKIRTLSQSGAEKIAFNPKRSQQTEGRTIVIIDYLRYKKTTRIMSRQSVL